MHSSTSNIYFGGPDLKQYLLRDVLVDSIRNTPTGGHISWMCYYLNEPKIIQTLLDAANRGVNIIIFIDANPRVPEVNLPCIAQLRQQSSIKVITAQKKPIWEYFGVNWHPHFHAKLYYFSHPNPHILIGSYNPTAGSEQLSHDMLQQIGDHSTSHNVLIDIADLDITRNLNRYTCNMQKPWYRKLARVLPSHNHCYRNGEWEINFLPRIRPHPIKALLNKKDDNAILRCAISHLKGPGIMGALTNALRLGKKIEILLEPSERRVSKNYLSFLERNQIPTYRPTLPKYCLMHNKFILYKTDNEQRIMFGSFNWSARSRYLNHEIIASTTNNTIFSAFQERWLQMLSTV